MFFNLIAKIGVDAAENEPRRVCHMIMQDTQANCRQREMRAKREKTKEREKERESARPNLSKT